MAGRLFHTFGPATEQLLSPSRVLVRGTVRALASVERRQRRPESAISWQSSARYDGVSPRNDWKTIMASLKTTRCFTGSQCKRDRTGEMWSRRVVPVNRRAAAFWIDCRRRYKLSVIPYRVCYRPSVRKFSQANLSSCSMAIYASTSHILFRRFCVLARSSIQLYGITVRYHWQLVPASAVDPERGGVPIDGHHATRQLHPVWVTPLIAF